MKYTRSALTRALAGLAERLDRSPRAEDIVAEPKFPSVAVFHRHFGSLPLARKAAGLPEPERKKKWSKEAVRVALIAAAEELGATPRGDQLKSIPHAPSIDICRARFGSYRQAVAAAGLTMAPRRRRDPDDDIPEMLEALKRAAAARNDPNKMRPMSQAEFNEARTPFTAKVVKSRFGGSWIKALKAAGLPAARRNPQPTRAVLIERLKYVLERHSGVPRLEDLRHYRDVPPATAFQKEFKTWRAALLAAGVPPETLGVDLAALTDEQCLEALRELARRLGRTPDSKVIQLIAGFPGPSFFANRFGTWNDALEQAGLPVTRRKSKAKDGHRCDSRNEKMVDDFLFDHNIPHTLHPLYPHHISLNPRTSLIADWKLNDGTLVEYFGLMTKPWYAAKAKRKQQLADATGLQLISVFQEDLKFARLRELFQDFL